MTLGLCDAAVRDRIVRLLERLGLPVQIPASLPAAVDQLLAAMSSDKKKKESRLRFVVPRQIGEVEVVDNVPVSMIVEAWHAVGAE